MIGEINCLPITGSNLYTLTMKTYYPSKEHIASLDNNEVQTYLCLEYENNPIMESS